MSHPRVALERSLEITDGPSADPLGQPEKIENYEKLGDGVLADVRMHAPVTNASKKTNRT